MCTETVSIVVEFSVVFPQINHGTAIAGNLRGFADRFNLKAQVCTCLPRARLLIKKRADVIELALS